MTPRTTKAALHYPFLHIVLFSSKEAAGQLNVRKICRKSYDPPKVGQLWLAQAAHGLARWNFNFHPAAAAAVIPLVHSLCLPAYLLAHSCLPSFLVRQQILGPKLLLAMGCVKLGE